MDYHDDLADLERAGYLFEEKVLEYGGAGPWSGRMVLYCTRPDGFRVSMDPREKRGFVFAEAAKLAARRQPNIPTRSPQGATGGRKRKPPTGGPGAANATSSGD